MTVEPHDYLSILCLAAGIAMLIRAKLKYADLEITRKRRESQMKSREVLVGHALEKLAPYINGLGVDPKTAQFLGQPIDFISFGEDEITFIEVKSGKSQLSQKQRKIRELVKEKKVNWKEVRLSKSH